MDSAILALAQLFGAPGTLGALLLGCLAGVAVGLTPGTSSRSALLVAIPFVTALDPLVAVIALVALHAASQVSGTIPAVLFGAPTSASEAATAMDGYPLARQGAAAQVIGTIISASALGGVFGAAVLLLVAPFLAKFLLLIGTPEIAALSVVGIVAIAAVSSSGIGAGVALGAAGIAASTIGLDAITAMPRFTFGNTELLDGLSAPAVIAGMVAIPELLRVDPPAEGEPVGRLRLGRILAGSLEPFRHWALSLKSSLIGLVVGLTPGIGTSVAVWLSYGQAARSSDSKVAFGEGAIEGVIAPEIASGAKEGGAFIPTLFLGIPGSSSMAILLGAFAIVGVKVGPSMLSTRPELPAVVALTVGIADLMAFGLCLLAAPVMVRMASVPRHIVVIVSIVAAILAAYYAAPLRATAIEILLFSIAGVALAWGGIARPPFLIGFVIGPIFESAFLRSSQIYGAGALLRPGVLLIGGLLAAAIFLLERRRKRQAMPSASRVLTRHAVWPLLGLAALLGLLVVLARGYPRTAGLVPMLAAGLGAAAALLTAARLVLAKGAPRSKASRFDWRLAGLAGLGLLASLIVGPAALALPLLALLPPLLHRLRRRNPVLHP